MGESMFKNSKLFIYACLAFGGGCLGDPGVEPDEPETDIAAQEIAQPSNHFQSKSFGGNITSQRFNYITEQFDPSGNCTVGFKRPEAPEVTWRTNGGGFCQFNDWATDDIHDCRAQIVGSTGGAFFGGDCETLVREVPEAPGSTTPAGQYSYTGFNTNSAQVNTTDYLIPLSAGQTLIIGTCGVVGATFSGDTFLRLANQAEAEVAANDDQFGACGRASQITYTAPAGGTYKIRGGCWSSTGCSGTVSWTIQ
jgi:hypothetical protein